MNLILVLIGTWIAPQALANDITLHFVPSPAGINWRKPDTLAYSAIYNQVAKVRGGKRHEIGHVYEEINCGDRHFFTDVTSVSNNEERNAIFKQGYGLGIVLKNYEGTMSSSEEIEKDLNAMHATGRSSFMKFLVSPSSCARMLEYYDEYLNRGYDKIYAGLNARPLWGESSGCSAFGMSFLETIGLQIPEFEKSWTRSYIMPRRFVGGKEFTGYHVSIFKILVAFRAQWDRDLSYNGIPITFWDPEKMNTWTRNANRALQRNQAVSLPWPVERSSLKYSPGLIVDATQVPTPEGPIFKVPAPVQN